MWPGSCAGYSCPILELLTVVQAWEGRARYVNAQEATQGLPTVTHLVYQQPLRGHSFLHLAVVPLEGSNGRGPVVHALGAEAPHDGSDHLHETRRRVKGPLVPPHPEDRAAGTLIPLRGIAHREHHLGLGIRLHELLVELAGGQVHGGLVAPEQPFPVGGFPSPMARHKAMWSGWEKTSTM